MDRIAIDIEVAPHPDLDRFETNVDGKKITISDRNHPEWHTSQLNPWTGIICAVGVAGIISNKTVSKGFVIEEYSFEAESKLVEAVKRLIHNVYMGWDQGRDPCFITFNGISFDFPYIYSRCIAHRISQPLVPLNVLAARYKYFPHFDIREAVNNWQWKRGSLEDLGWALLGERKADLDYTNMESYCKSDAGRDELSNNVKQHAEMTYKIGGIVFTNFTF